jgi:hypothetical protein
MINGNKPVEPNPDWMNKAQESARNVAKEVSGPMKMPETVKEALQDAAEHLANTADSVTEGAKSLWNAHPAESIAKKMNIFGSDTNPVKLIETIRSAEGTDQAKLLLGFQKELDEMSSKQLDAAMKHIVTEMSDEHNLDDPLLGALAKSVMEESSSRGKKTLPQPHWPNIPRPLPVDPGILKPLHPNVIKQLDNIRMD